MRDCHSKTAVRYSGYTRSMGVSVAFNRSLLGSLTFCARLGGRLARLGRWAPGLVGAGVGAAVGGLGWFVPSALGGGQRLVEAVLQGHIALSLIPLWFLLRFGLTMASYGCGAPGGIFAPLLVLGSLIGLAVGKVAHLWIPGTIDHPGAFAVVGMAAYFAAIVRAPLTGIVLIVEMTNTYRPDPPTVRGLFYRVCCGGLSRRRAHLRGDARA
jgi:chloride channel protein, CIC family